MTVGMAESAQLAALPADYDFSTSTATLVPSVRGLFHVDGTRTVKSILQSVRFLHHG